MGLLFFIQSFKKVLLDFRNRLPYCLATSIVWSVSLRLAQHVYKGEVFWISICWAGGAEKNQVIFPMCLARVFSPSTVSVTWNFLLSEWWFLPIGPAYKWTVVDIWKTQYIIFTVFKWCFYTKPFALQMIVLFPPWRLTVMSVWITLKILVLES